MFFLCTGIAIMRTKDYDISMHTFTGYHLAPMNGLSFPQSGSVGDYITAALRLDVR